MVGTKPTLPDQLAEIICISESVSIILSLAMEMIFQIFVIFYHDHSSFMLLDLFFCHASIIADNHFISQAHLTGCCAIYPDNSATGFTFYHICRKSVTVTDIVDFYFFVYQHAAG